MLRKALSAASARVPKAFSSSIAVEGGPQAQVVLQRVLLDLLDRGLADAARRRVDDAQQADGVVRA